jgi:hypothetical protein
MNWIGDSVTSVRPIEPEPLPPFKAGDRVSVTLDMVEKGGKHAFGTVDGRWVVEVAPSSGRPGLAIGQRVEVVITETRPGHASGRQV